jgi:hypothetical protein
LYLINYLSLQTAQQLFVAVGRYRTGSGLIGPRDGTNFTFHSPGYEKFVHNLPFLTPSVYLNGVRQTFFLDYVVIESYGPGAGYDTIVLNRAPRHDDSLIADYVVTSS